MTNNTNAPTEWVTDAEDAPTLRSVIETVKQAHDECLDESYASSRAILRDVIADLESLASRSESAPPAPEAERWPLTVDEITDLWEEASRDHDDGINIYEFARAIERAHGINTTEGE